MTDEAALPWEKQPDETPRAYAAFCMFRDLGPGRKLVDVARALYPGKDCRTQVKQRWSRPNRWLDRVAAWDAHLQATALAAAEEETRQKAGALEAEKIQAARERLMTGRAGVRLVLKWIAAQTDPSAVPAGTIPGLLKTCADLARIEDGESTAKIDGPPFVVKILRGVSMDDL